LFSSPFYTADRDEEKTNEVFEAFLKAVIAKELEG
jgi:hypothetical protein